MGKRNQEDKVGGRKTVDGEGSRRGGRKAER